MKARRASLRLAEAFAASAAAENVPPKATRPFSIRLTQAERKALEVAAGARPVGTFVREQLLGAAVPRKAARRPSSDAAALGQILATLGRSKLAASLADLGEAARLGTIVITPEAEAQIRTVCADIQEVKRMLLRGLGLAEERGQ